MTNTKKDIIGLIEPFMEKTLEKWCLLKLLSDWKIIYWEYDNKFEYSIKEQITKQFTFPDNKEFLKYWEVFDDENKSIYNYQILWHYDITAVLKYIEGKSFWDLIENKCINIVWDNLYTYLSWIDVYIPNKPLHLYTDQEETELLKLLKKIK